MVFILLLLSKIMSKEDKNYAPQSTAGLIRYFDSEDSGFKMSPKSVALVSTGLGFVVILLKFLA